MQYEKSQFKKHYGNNLIRAMYSEIIAFALSIIVFVLKIPILYLISGVLIGFIPMIILPATFCGYIRLKRQSERQRQWFSNGNLYMERGIDNGFTAGGFVAHKITVLFESVDSIETTNRYIIVKGKVHVIEIFNGVNREKDLFKYKIPRNFSCEEQILKLGGNIYG